MIAPFQPGDVVQCVDALGPPLMPWEPRLNGVYRVRDCLPDRKWDGDSEDFSDPWAVDLHEDPDGGGGEGWPSRMFRKIDDEVTEEFREQLRRIKSPISPTVCFIHSEPHCVLCDGMPERADNSPASLLPSATGSEDVRKTEPSGQHRMSSQPFGRGA